MRYVKLVHKAHTLRDDQYMTYHDSYITKETYLKYLRKERDNLTNGLPLWTVALPQERHDDYSEVCIVVNVENIQDRHRMVARVCSCCIGKKLGYFQLMRVMALLDEFEHNETIVRYADSVHDAGMLPWYIQ